MHPLPSQSIGLPLIILFFALLVINVICSRNMTVIMIQMGYLVKGTEQYKKAIILWWIPLIGGFGLIMLFIALAIKRFILRSVGPVKAWFTLSKY